MASVQLKMLSSGNGPLGRTRRFFRPWTRFFRAFVKDPAMIGSIVPSSQALVRAMLAPVDWADTRLFVEYGPGVGTFSRTVLARLRPDAMLICIDTNADFVQYLNGDIADRRFKAVHGSAADVQQIITDHGFLEADYILSGLPFSTLPAGVGEGIIAQTHAALKPGGAFLVYQYSRYAVPLLSPYFDTLTCGFEWINVPPCHMFWAYKAPADPALVANPGQDRESSIGA